MSYVVDPVTGELVDPTTGEVVESHPIVVNQPEYRILNSNDWVQRAHYGKLEPYRVHDGGLHTWIEQHRARNRALARKLAKLNESVRVTHHYMVRALKKLNRVAAILELPETATNTAAMIAKKLIKSLPITSSYRRLRYIVAASIIAACRIHSIPVAVEKILELLEINNNVGKSVVWKLLERLYMDGTVQNRLDASSYVGKIANDLGLSPEATSLALRLAETARRLRITEGRNPRGVAAAAVYLASILMNERRLQKALTKIASVAEVTIRNRVRELVEKAYIEVLL